MMKIEKELMNERIIELRDLIKKHDIAYAKGQPLITDSEYDMLYMELVDLEEKYPEFFDKNSPTQKIYDITVDGLEKMEHKTPMLSQEKINNEEGLDKFLAKANDRIIVQQKLDGLTIVLHYDKGVLVNAVSRGNGYIGDIVNHIALNTPSIPKRIPFAGKLEVRAEGLIPKDMFEKINMEIENPEERYKSARNLASGTVRNLSGIVAKERGLKVIAYDLVSIDTKEFTKDEEQLEFLKSLGFEVVEYKVFEHTKEGIDNLKEYIFDYNDKIRPTLNHDIDGLVLKFNDLEIRKEMGYTSKHPRWGCAFKFKSLDATTKLLDVVWSVGKNGQLTPNAILEPCEIDGVTISRASLANYDDITKRGFKIGDTVFVIRANDVIPKVIAPIIENRTGEEKEIEMISKCPVCNSTLEKDISLNGEEGVHLYCVNSECKAQLAGKIQHYVSRNAMNIEGLGDKTIEQLLENNIINSIVDIYKLKDNQDKLLSLDKFGKRKVSKLLESIENTKNAQLQNVLYGLSIRYIGETGAKKIANHYKTMRNILEISKDKDKFYNDLLLIEDIGEGTALSITKYFSNSNNVKMIDDLLNNGVIMEQTNQTAVKTSNITGKTFVITGTFNKSRKEIQAYIESLGAKVSGSVSKKTDYLLIGENAGSKLDKAKSLGVEILTEEEFNLKVVE